MISKTTVVSNEELRAIKDAIALLQTDLNNEGDQNNKCALSSTIADLQRMVKRNTDARTSHFEKVYYLFKDYFAQEYNQQNQFRLRDKFKSLVLDIIVDMDNHFMDLERGLTNALDTSKRKTILEEMEKVVTRIEVNPE